MARQIPILWGFNNGEVMAELTRLEHKYGTINDVTGKYKAYSGAGEYGEELALMASGIRRILELITPKNKMGFNGNYEIDFNTRKIVRGEQNIAKK